MTENQRIKILRQEAKMSQKELAEAMGLDQSAISSVESGKNKATKNFKILLSHILRIRLEFIETGEGEKLWPYPVDDNSDNDSPLYKEAIRALNDLIIEKNNRLSDKDEIISMLKEKLALKSAEDDLDSNKIVQRQLIAKEKSHK